MTLDPAPSELTKSAKCGCKKSKCEAKSCGCFGSGVSCSDLCSCVDCKNTEETEAEVDLLNDDSGDDLSEGEC
jgi:hypothetical protein